MDPLTIALIIGGAAGLLTYGYSAYTQYQQNKQNLKVAEQQYELAKQTAQQEDQDRNKVNKRQVDVDSLLTENTSSGLGENVLTGANGAGALGALGTGFGYKNKLKGFNANQQTSMLGG